MASGSSLSWLQKKKLTLSWMKTVTLTLMLIVNAGSENYGDWINKKNGFARKTLFPQDLCISKISRMCEVRYLCSRLNFYSF